MRDGGVDQLVFFATHQLDGVDVRLLRAFGNQLRSPRIHSWLLLKVDDGAATLGGPEQSTTDVGLDGAFSWTEDALFRAFPRLRGLPRHAEALARKAAAAAHASGSNESGKQWWTNRRYWWLHASLALWNRTHGGRYAGARYWWRIEPDVLYAGNLRSFVESTASFGADLVVPKLTTQAQDPEYGYWSFHADLLRAMPPTRRMYSLVALTRTTPRFISLLTAEYWERGIIGYEELFLPHACLSHETECTLGSLSRGAKVQHTLGWNGAHFRYRPNWPCDAFAQALRQPANEVWHPVKHRDCVAAALDPGSRAAANLEASVRYMYG